MANRLGLIQLLAAGTALSAAALAPTSAFAQRGCCEGGTAPGANAWTAGLAAFPVPDWGPPAGPPFPVIPNPASGRDWWFHGEVEAGGRAFLNDPARNGSAFLGQNSLAKYYEYSTIAPGPFAGGHVAGGSRNGLYGFDLWANNVGYSDQGYWLNASKIGEQYLSLKWDQTPHLYSTSSLTPYLGVGSNSLTLPLALLNGAAADSSIIVPFLHQTDIGIRRDTGSVQYRWTPTQAWDVRADYSHMSRTGTQVAGVVGFSPAGANVFAIFGSPTQVPKPVDDTTQNFGMNGEYAGTSPWGQRYTFKAAYQGSQYTDNLSSFTAQNPYCTGMTAASCSPFFTVSPVARISLPPSNQANGVSGTLAAELPLKSRYVGTASYTMMRQDVAFQPFTANPSAVASPFGPPWNSTAALPVSSLNGAINTFLSNNVLTSQITPELKSKLSYRYYDYQNDTPRIIFPTWVSFDQTGFFTENTISSLTMSYVKQDANAELNWRPVRDWNLGARYGYQRYDYTQADASATTENSGTLSADWKPTSWFTARTSGTLAERRYSSYDYTAFVKSVQFPTVPGFAPTTNEAWFYSPAYRQFMFDNRERTRANVTLDLVAFRGVTVSPSFRYQNDDYGLDTLSQEGVNDSRSTSWGVDVAYVVNRRLSFFVSYYREHYHLSLFNWTDNGFNSATPGPPNFMITTFDRERVNTLTLATSFTPIPDTLDVDLRYTISIGVNEQTLSTAAPAAVCPNCAGAFPDDTTSFQRLDATATYKFDPMVVRRWGWNGDVKAKVRYAWERNSVNNWQNDPLAPFTTIPALSAGIWLAYNNPNYNAQLIAASLIAGW
jgi:MtrB/PioB family decaheme-associated outer membrane protein